MNKDEIYIDLDFGEVVYVKATGIKSMVVDDNYVFTINYTDGTSQKVPTVYRDFADILNQLKAQNAKGDEFIKNFNSVMAGVTYPLASSSSNGLMSASDKTKLDNLDSTISTAISDALAAYDNADTTTY